MIIRAAKAEEAKTLGKIGFSSWRDSEFAVHDAGRTDPEILQRDFEEFCAGYWGTVLVATDFAHPLGWGAREFGNEIISDLWVAPEAQGRGIGAALLAALEAAIALDGLDYAELETYSGNAGAVRFYERQGYDPVWRGMKFSASLNYDLDKIRFRKTLLKAA